MRVSLLLIVLPLLVITHAHADEPTLLERLNAETVDLAKAGRAAVVEVRVFNREAPGVLAGTPPRIVVERVVVDDAAEITFRLADGTEGTAQKLAGDAEFGIAIYALPAEVEARAKGLTPAPAWGITEGRLAILCGERPELILLPGTTGPKSRLQVHTETPGSVLLAANGDLLGYRVYAVRHRVVAPAQKAFRTQHPAMPLVLYTDLLAARRAENLRSAAVLALGRALAQPPHPTPPRPAPAVAFVPGALIARVLRDVEEHGRIRHAYLGVVPGEVAEGEGARLVTVVPDSPGAEAGLRDGDVIRAVDGLVVANPSVLTELLVLKAPGDRLVLKIDGRIEPLRLVLGDRSEAQEQLVSPSSLGMVTMDLTPELARFLDLDEETQGVVVRKAPAGSWGARAGLQRGDVIVAGDAEPVRDIQELLAALNGAKEAIELTILRGGERVKVKMTLPQPAPKESPR